MNAMARFSAPTASLPINPVLTKSVQRAKLPIHTAYIMEANAIPRLGLKYLTIRGAQIEPIPNDMYKTDKV